MIFKSSFRFINTNNVLYQVSKKSLLANLRKKTGYTFANCKKALELNEHNLEKAELWLNEQAQALGWSKAQQLQNRTTNQGLIAVIIDKFHAALVEINCETDFVARTEKFQGLANTVASTVLEHTKNKLSNDVINKSILDSNALKSLSGPEGKSISDHTALIIGEIRENLSLRRALCMSVPTDVLLIGRTHPYAQIENICCGKYGVLLAYKTDNSKDSEEIGKNLCQHIIGMNPTKIGDPKVDEPNPNKDDETVLINQEFLLDRNFTVNDYLQETKSQILDYTRFEMGEIMEGEQSLDAVETGG